MLTVNGKRCSENSLRRQPRFFQLDGDPKLALILPLHGQPESAGRRKGEKIDQESGGMIVMSLVLLLTCSTQLTVFLLEQTQLPHDFLEQEGCPGCMWVVWRLVRNIVVVGELANLS